MFRRRLNLSWPLIVALFGLFLLSLRVPRQWEKIARDSRLALLPRASVSAMVASTPSAAFDKTPDLTSFRVVEPAGAVGNNAAVAADVSQNPIAISPPPANVRTAAEVTPVSAEQPKAVEIAVASEPAANQTVQTAVSGPQLEPSAVATEAKPSAPDTADNPLRSEAGPALANATVPEPSMTATAQPASEAAAAEPNPTPLRGRP